MFIAVRAVPLPRLVVPFVLKANRDSIVGEGPELLHEPVVQFLGPFSFQELFDSFPAGEKLGAIAPL